MRIEDGDSVSEAMYDADCPCCGHAGVDVLCKHGEGLTTMEECRCRECGANWNEHFQYDSNAQLMRVVYEVDDCP